MQSSPSTPTPAWFPVTVSENHLPDTSGGSAATVIDLLDDPFSNGVTHGRLAEALIRHNLNIIEQTVLRDQDPVIITAFWDLLHDNAAFVGSVEPDISQEVAGIAEGAGISVDQAWTLAIPAHVIKLAVDQECSQVLVRHGRSRSGLPILAKSRDFHAGQEYRQVFLRHRYPDGTVVAAMHTAGSITYPGVGLTNHGIAFATSGVFSPLVQDDPSRAAEAWVTFNAQPVARKARSASEFRDLSQEMPRFRGINMVVADREDAFTLELTGQRTVERGSSNDYLQLTNHYQADDPELQTLTPTVEQYPSTYARAACARFELSNAEAWGPAEVAGLMSSHQGYPNSSICRHIDESHAESKGTTVAVGIADVDSQILWGLNGHACQADPTQMEHQSTRLTAS